MSGGGIHKVANANALHNAVLINLVSDTGRSLYYYITAQDAMKVGECGTEALQPPEPPKPRNFCPECWARCKFCPECGERLR